MSLRMSTDPETTPLPAAPRVVAVVTADDPVLLRPCLEAIGRQVYGPARVIVVGGSDEVRKVAGETEAMWRPNLRAVYDALGPEVTYVWALRQRARPEPGALAALIRDGGRADASVAGSKVVDAANPEVLVSVGYATDVFDAPYSGLQPGELDQSQYDVIRDVAAVSDTSMLIRRDLFRGLGGVDPAMPPTSAAIDFCQRARLRGARVVVVPSSVVRYEGPDPAPRWRERAGETRAMIKAYSPLTLAWAIPVAFVVGLVESILGIFVGRMPLAGLLAAGVWNLVHLPSALKARFQARRGRQTGDEELFRYQINGSARLRALWDVLAERIRHRFPEGVLSGFAEAVESGQQRIRNPAFFMALLVVVLGLVATRQIWGEALPIVGFSLPPPDSPVDALAAYAGGWNPAGFGSPEVLRPHIAVTALVQMITFARAGLAVALIVVTSFLAGAFGTARLLRRWEVGPTPGLLAGVVLMAGPAMAAIGSTTRWMAIPAVAALPWVLLVVLRPIPGGLRGRFGAAVTTTLVLAIVAGFAPAVLPVPLVAVAAWAALGVGGDRVRPLVTVAVATVLAIPLLMPWVLFVDLGGFWTGGEPAFWTPSGWLVAFGAAAVAGVLVTGERTLGALAAWGGVVAVAGAAVARTGGLGGGAEASVAGLAGVALGMAIVTGAALEIGGRRRTWGGVTAVAVRAGAVGAALVVASTLLLVGPGRAGLPQDVLSDSFRFAAGEGSATTRILMFGPADTLPGEHRTFDGLPYRVIIPPYPATWEAHLNAPRLGDDALEDLLTDIVEGNVRRAGDALAGFGIGWVVFTERSPLEALFEAQLDLVPLRSLDFPVFRNEVVTGPAVSEDGVIWERDGTGFVDPTGAGGTVRLAINGDDRWGPGTWIQDEWAATITGSGGTLAFGGYPPRRFMALASAAWLLVLLGAWAMSREENP